MIGTGVARGTATTTVADTNNLVVSPSGNIPAGSLVVINAVSDNVGTTDANTTGHTITDTDGHTWTRLAERTESSGVALDGLTLSVWITKTTAQISTGDSITLAVSVSSKKAFRITEYPITAGQTFQAVGSTQTEQGNASGVTGLQQTSMDAVHRLTFAVAGIESSSQSVNNDTDFTDLGDVTTSGGGGGTNVRCRAFYDLASGTSSDTFNPTFTAAIDYVAIMVSVEAVDATAPTPPTMVLRVSDFDAAGGSSLTCKGFRMAGEAMLLTLVQGVSAGSSSLATPSLSGATFDQLDTQAPSPGARRVTTWLVTGVSTGAVSISFGESQSFFGYILADLFGLEPSSSILVQKESFGSNTAVASRTWTLSAFADSANMAYVGMMHGTNPSNPTTYDGGWVELYDTTNNTENMTPTMGFHDGEDTSFVTSWASNDHYLGCAMELALAGGADATVNPGAMALSATIPQAGPTASSTVSPGVISVPVTTPQVGASASSTVNPGAMARSVTMGQVGITANSTVSPGAVPLAFLVPQVTVTAGGSTTVNPDPIVRAFAVPQASPQAASSVTPGAMARSFVIPQATASGASDATASPAAMARSFLIPQATASGGGSATANPGAVFMLVTIPAAQGRAASTVSPGLIAALFTIPQATTDDGSFVHPRGPVGARVTTGASSARAVNGSVDAEAM